MKKNPNSLNFNVNSPNLVHICGYEVPITGQFFSKKKLNTGQDIVKSFFEKKIKKLTQAKYIARSASLPSGLNK